MTTQIVPTDIYTVANDLGYGYTKLLINHNKQENQYTLPSVIAIQQAQNITKPLSFEHKEDMDAYMHQFLKHIDVTINSPSVSTPGRFLVGPRAVTADIPVRSFDINSMIGKSNDDLSVILTLSFIAAQVAQEKYKQGIDIFKQPIDVNVVMATALPISEGKRNNVTQNYANKFLNKSHRITFNNFEKPIDINLTFNRVFVALEGEAAQFKIANDNDDLKFAIYDQFIHQYPSMKDEVTADDLIRLDDVAGIDIGAVTVDFPIIKNGKAEGNASTSLPNGYDNTVLQNALDVLQSQGQSFNTITNLKNYLQKDLQGLAKLRKKSVLKTVYNQHSPFEDQIISELSKTIRRAGSNTQIVYVYGGGSIPLGLQTNLQQKLSDKIKEFTGGFDVPVIWIPKEYAQELNMLGLELIAKQLLKDLLTALSSNGGNKHD